MKTLRIPEPISGGIFLTYKCNSRCKHCMYACSPQWKADWISLEDAEKILHNLSKAFGKRYPKGYQEVGVNLGLHFTGGEPFLNFNLGEDSKQAEDSFDVCRDELLLGCR